MSEKFYTLQLNAKVQPLDRGEIFEDPLDEILQAENLGGVDGGGTMMGVEPGTIDFCEVEIFLKNFSIENEQKLLKILENFGIPKGSILRSYEENDEIKEIPVWTLEGLCFSLDGVNLPDEVYEKCDINNVVDVITEKFQKEKVGNFYSHQRRDAYTDLIFYWENFEKMKATIEDFVPTYPLCENSLITQIT